MKQALNILAILLMLFSSTTLVAQKDTLKLQREARSLLRTGNDLYGKEKYAEASIAYRKALDKNSKYEKATYNYGNALYQDKKYKEAVEQYKLTAANSKDKFHQAAAYHNIGNAMMDQKQYQGAVDAYKNSLRRNPGDDETRYNLAVAQKLLEKEKQDQKNDQNKDGKDNKDQKDQKDNKDQQNKDDQNKDKKDDKKDNKEGDDKDKKEGDDKKDQKGNEGKDEEKEKPKPQKGKMSPEQVKQLLESLNNEENKTQKKMNVQKSKGKKVQQEKDW